MTSTISGRVQEVLTELNLNQRQLAAQIELDEDKLSKAMNGVRQFSSLELARIAEVSGKTVEWLISGVVPRDVVFAARASHPHHDDFVMSGKAVAKAYIDAHDALQILNRARSIPTTPSLQESGSFVADGRAMAEWATSRITTKELIDDTPSFLLALEDKFGVNIASTDQLPQHCDGLSFEDNNFRLILVATTPNWTRRRFTIAHELGHVLWGDARATWLSEEVSTTNSEDYREKRANSFAANFLMPETAIRSFMDGRVLDEATFHSLAMTFRVSPSALVARLYKLGLIEASQVGLFRSYRALDSARAADAMPDLLAEQNFSSMPMPPLFMLSQFVRAYLEGETTTRHLEKLSGIPGDAWRALLNSGPISVEASDALVADNGSDQDTERELSFLP
jgi:Zn-dependent peptidase ImmA (M78 family)/transcriptional regulator with XRE-family HTH domain